MEWYISPSAIAICVKKKHYWWGYRLLSFDILPPGWITVDVVLTEWLLTLKMVLNKWQLSPILVLLLIAAYNCTIGIWALSAQLPVRTSECTDHHLQALLARTAKLMGNPAGGYQWWHPYRLICLTTAAMNARIYIANLCSHVMLHFMATSLSDGNSGLNGCSLVRSTCGFFLGSSRIPIFSRDCMNFLLILTLC